MMNVLSFFSRKKNIFKLAQGEYIAPEKIENSYIRSQFISQCFIHGIPFTLMNLLKNVDYVLDIIGNAFSGEYNKPNIKIGCIE